MDENKFILECSCGCGLINFVGYTKDYFDEDEDFAIYSMYYATLFDKRSNLFTRLKLIWNILRNKEYCFYDVVISKKQLQEFKDWVSNL